jgi:benzoyl-CoA reductase subunit B
MKKQIWETRPLEFWAKAKELRAGWQKSIESKEKVVGQGNTFGLHVDWSAAFPALTIIEDNPVGAMMSNKNSSFARKCRLAGEVRGWGREICGYQGNCWGSQFLGYQEDSSEFPLRKLVVPMPCVCDQHAKRGQQCRDFAPVPQWMSDLLIYFGPFDQERNDAMMEHKVYCNWRILNDIERIFGQKFDDEYFVELLKDINQIKEYGKEIAITMATTVPSPLSVKDIYSVYTIGGLTRVDPQATLDFWKAVRDEVKWRAENHIAAVGNERFRWIEAHPPSWHFMKYYRYMEKYGAVCLGSQYSSWNGFDLEEKPDGSIDYRKVSRYPADTPVISREDACRFVLGPDVRVPAGFKNDEYIHRSAIVEFAKMNKIGRAHV